MTRFDTLADILPADAREDRAVTFIDGEAEQRVQSFRRLRQRAVDTLGALQRLGLEPGDRVIVCLADNERFLEVFWACVLGGMVPVPLSAGGTDEHGRKLVRVFEQLSRGTRPPAICLDAPALDRLEALVAAHGTGIDAASLRARAVVPAGLDVAGRPGRPHAPAPDDLAYIQYSSGSTGEPKGVLLTHRNLSVNIAAISEAAAYTDRDSVLSWMPLSHDMGLIGFHLNMLACGAEHAIMRTELFARRPLLWLSEAARRRATVLCSPNFGYQHYLRQYAAKPPSRLDLSSVRLVFDGAEPISAALCRRFLQTMAPHGLRGNALLAVYGLAEASLAVAFPRLGAPLETLWLDRRRLEVGAPVRVVAPGAEQATEFVKLGSALRGTEIRIVDAAGAVLAEGSVGHVLIRGANVTSGYFADIGAAGDAVPVAPVRSADGWLDTGDLGLVDAGQLVVTGRAKDIVFVNGQNVYPHDVERLAEAVPGIESQRVAAAGVPRADGEGEALALFVLHRGELVDFVPRALELRRAVNRHAGLEVAHVVPVGRIPKTTSGKLQRHALATAFERGEFDAVLARLAPWLAAAGAGDQAADSPDAGTAPTLARLQAICARVVPDRQIAPDTHLMEINLNSLGLARIHEAIDREFPGRLEVTDLFDYPTLAELAGFIDARPA